MAGRLLRAVFRSIDRLLLLLVCGALAFSVNDAFAQDVHRLTEKGARLGTIYVGKTVEDLRLKIDLDNDVATSTHVYAQLGGSEFRQRTNDGYWIPWDGNLASLIDNQFRPVGQEIEYKILHQDLGSDNSGITLVIGYRADSKFKYGMLGLIPKPETPQ